MRSITIGCALAAVAACAVEVDGSQPDEGVDPELGRSRHTACASCGAPLAGLDKTQRAAFAAGLEEFEEVESLDEGVGPVFNGLSCAECHDTPAVGGSGTTLETRFGAQGSDIFDALVTFGGSLRQDRGIGELGGCELGPELTPEGANVEALRRTTPLFGLGLVDAVPDATLVQLAASQPASIRGVVHWVTEPGSGQRRVGRFGWKAQVASLRTFSGDAYLNEMGITSPDFKTESCPQGDCARLVDCDLVPDPEDDGSTIVAFTDFMSLLAPPAPSPISTLRYGLPLPSAVGQVIFGKIGCAGCHQPTLVTGPSATRPLDRVKLHPYSDFLLHDMGALGDGITQGLASGRLMRTSPLWGVSAQALFLHDGRATTLGAAIRAHDGQAAPARDRFVALTPTLRQAVIAFLQSL